MSQTRRAAIRGGLIGGGVAVPMGLLLGSYLRGVLFADAGGARSVVFVALITLVFVAWGVFIGGMLNAQARGGDE